LNGIIPGEHCPRRRQCCNVVLTIQISIIEKEWASQVMKLVAEGGSHWPWQIGSVNQKSDIVFGFCESQRIMHWSLYAVVRRQLSPAWRCCFRTACVCV